MLRLFLRYYLDLPWRFRSARDRFLTLGSALAARLKLSLDKLGGKLWLNTKFLELVQDSSELPIQSPGRPESAKTPSRTASQ